MRVRHLVALRKTMASDTQWQTTDLPPRHAPVYAKTRPIRTGWRWRSCQAAGGGRQFTLLAQCNPGRDNWSAVLMVANAEGYSVVARYEHHGSHPGLHAHAHCERGGIEVGSTGLGDLVRSPSIGTVHRRMNAWTEGTFWDAATRFFRVETPRGTLI